MSAAPDAVPPQLRPSSVSVLIDLVADCLQRPGTTAASTVAIDTIAAAELGEVRYAQQASVRQVLTEYQTLSEVLHDFVESEASRLTPALDVAETFRLLRCIGDSLRTLEQRTIDAFVGMYVETIERQTQQLRGFTRLVRQEVRRPLGVLQVAARMLPVEPGDVEATRVSDILERSLRRLIEVTDRLERAARVTRATDVMPGDQRVDLSAVAGDIAYQLDQVAAEQGVQVRIQENLPVLKMDQAHAELVFLNLIANGIKHSDPEKSRRFVEVVNVPGRREPTVIVRDNGVGIDVRTRQQIFRELDRGHAQRSPEMAAHALGIGFAVVRRCMDAAGGNVHVESCERQGTTVTLTWPSSDAGGV